MRVLVVGSGGVGTAAAMIARRRQFFDQMVMTDIDPARAAAAAAKTGDARFTSDQLDASDRAAVAACVARATAATSCSTPPTHGS